MILMILMILVQVPVLPVPEVSPVWDEERGRAGGEAEGEQVEIFILFHFDFFEDSKRTEMRTQ